MERVILVYATFSSMVEAERTGHQMVERRLAASVNILPRVVSYSWQEGTVERGEEIIAVFKTRMAIAETLRTEIRNAHSSSTPPIFLVSIDDADSGYQAWIVEETTTS
jgi:periplasmic divalent cation tolerance protein